MHFPFGAVNEATNSGAAAEPQGYATGSAIASPGYVADSSPVATTRRSYARFICVTQYLPSNIVNDRDRPRVILLADEEAELTTFPWLEERCGTYRRINSLGDIDPSEWDVLVTPSPYATMRTTDWGSLVIGGWSRVPDHLFIFHVFSGNLGRAGSRFFEFNLDRDGDADPNRALARTSAIPGHQVRRIGSLPEPIQDLVNSALVAAVESRGKQFGIQVVGEQLAPGVLSFRPFLAGPGDVYLAASYERPGGASVWLIPNDVSDLAEWFDAALVEWHLKDRRKFPSVSTWQTNPEWDTRDERLAREHLSNLMAEYAQAVAAYEEAKNSAERELELAHSAATDPKALLSGQDDDLQQAALSALQSLGFAVEDMDLVWDPRERREDFRITDPDEPGWVAIADVTGVAKGAPGSKIATVLGYILKYTIEEKPARSPSLWVIVNQLFHRDPLTRGDLYRADDIRTIESHEGIAFDTSALYLLSQSIEAGSERASRCRAWLRASRGQVTVQAAKDWLADN